MARPPRLKIGDVVLDFINDEVKNDEVNGEFQIDDTYINFVTDDPPEVKLHTHYGRLPDAELGRKVFDADGIWVLYRDQQQERWGISLHLPTRSATPCRVAIFEHDFCAGDIYLQNDGPRHHRSLSPLGHPLDQVLMVHLLSRGRGVLLHACGVGRDGRGIIFVGVSGAGKSTLANLWRGQKDVTLLSDDRVIVRERGGRFWAYGTPWHGDARAASPEGAPLDQIFIIRHAAENSAARLAPADASSRLLARSFPTFWDAPGMAFTLEFLEKLSRTVPCYDLGFVPDASVVDFVRCLL
jgi:hypothetical protein